MMKKFIILFAFTWLTIVLCSAQSLMKVTGQVTDEQGEPLIGVNVYDKSDPSKGVITDMDGKYQVNVSEQSTLVFSFIGFAPKEVLVSGQNQIDVSLISESIGLDEVVAIGYATQKKTDLTGSVAQVKGEALKKDLPVTLTQAVAGKLAGVIATSSTGQPGKDVGSFSIRGKSTFGNNSALVLVDGVPRPWARIDPNDIADFVVLKDAASTAIYGARAANGVVLITTKRGSSQRAEISYTGSYTIEKPTIIPELMNAYEYAKYSSEGRINNGNEPLFTEEEIENYRIGKEGYESYDWWDAMMNESSPRKQHSISVSGGNDKIKYFVSGNILDQDGLMKSTSFDRKGWRTNLDAQVTKNINFSTNLSFRQENIVEGALDTDANEASPFYNIMESLPMYSPYVSQEGVVQNGLGYNGVNDSPIGRALHHGTFEEEVNYFQSDFQVDIKIPKIEGLTVSARYSYDRKNVTNNNFLIPYTYWIKNEDTGEYTETGGGETKLKIKKSDQYSQTFLAKMTYTKSFGKHNFDLLALAEGSETVGDWIWAKRTGFISTAIDQIFAGNDDLQKTDGSAYESARLGYAGRINYNYAGKYLLQVNCRYDGSYNFPKEGRWGFFPAVSMGWRVSEESFLKDNVEFISNLKLRVSYGQVGNDRVNPYQFLSAFQFNGSDAGAVYDGVFYKGIHPSVMANPNITWETATDYNVGLDFGLLKNKISGGVTYFYKKTEDILRARSASVPPTFGSKLPDENFARVDNKGFEAEMFYTDQKGAFKWTIGGTFTLVSNEVKEIDELATALPGLRRTGRPFDQVYGYISDGLFQSQDEIDNHAVQDGNENLSLQLGDIKYRDISGEEGIPDGKIDVYDQTQIGKSATPELMYGINMNLDYKNFSLTCNWQGAGRFDKIMKVYTFSNGNNSLKLLEDSWRPDNTDAEYPRLGYYMPVNNGQTSTFWLKDASFIRLKNLTIGYNLPKNIVFEKLGVQSVRLFATGTNLLTFSKIDFRDPEQPGGTSAAYPIMKSYTAGINITL